MFFTGEGSIVSNIVYSTLMFARPLKRISANIYWDNQHILLESVLDIFIAWEIRVFDHGQSFVDNISILLWVMIELLIPFYCSWAYAGNNDFARLEPNQL